MLEEKGGMGMKRFVLLAVLAVTWWCVPAFGAESIRILRSGEEVRLSQGILRQDGTLMMSMQDLAELTESELRQDGSVTAFGYRLKEGPVVLENEQTATLVEDVVYDCLGRKIPIAGKVLRKDGEIYLPARTIANALGYTVKWSRMDGAETFSVERPVMPRITLDVVYDKEEQRVKSVLRNREPQSFTYGAEFTLERMTTNGWERMREAEIRDIDDYGLLLDSRQEGISDGEREDTRRIFQPLPAGHYRLGLPFHFTYYIGEDLETVEDFLKGRLADYQNEPTPEHLRNLQTWLEYYHATKWGAPAFYFEGAELEPSDDGVHELVEGWYRYRKNTGYVLYGEFEVK